jgi:hypothetical protein
LAKRPAVDWDWVEGENRGESWIDFPDFFSRFDLGHEVNGSDGFIELPATSKNVGILQELER